MVVEVEVAEEEVVEEEVDGLEEEKVVVVVLLLLLEEEEEEEIAARHHLRTRTAMPSRNPCSGIRGKRALFERERALQYCQKSPV